MTRPRLIKRMRRKMWGGTADFRLFSDNTIKVRVDHPSNDPTIEMAMAGFLLKKAREVFGSDTTMDPVAWKDDP